MSDSSIYSLPELIRRGDLAAVEAALESGADLNACVRGFTALSAAASINDVGLVRKLLALGADVHHPNEETALHRAAIIDNPEMIQILLDAGENVNVQDLEGNTPLMRAVGSKSTEAVRLLLSHGAVVAIHSLDNDNGCYRDGLTAIDIAETLNSPNREEIIELLQAAPAHPDADSDPDLREAMLPLGLKSMYAREGFPPLPEDPEDPFS